jgi:hypothetical protein
MAANKGFGRAAYQEAFDRLGSKAAVAREFGVREKTVTESLKGAPRDPAVQGVMDAAGTGLIPDTLWLKTKDYSVQLRPNKQTPEDFLESVREAFANSPPIFEIEAPEDTDADLLTVYPIADAHVGMKSWGEETGENYDTDIAVRRIQDWIGRCIASSPASETAIILDVGDLHHADDNTNQTPKSKNPLDVDTRHFRTLDLTIAALVASVTLALAKHERVEVAVLPGNHNPTSYIAVLFALAAHFRDNPRVMVRKEPGEFFMREFGSVMIGAHHGDKSKAQNMVMFLADKYAEAWGRTKHRYLFSGHLHHHKSQDIGGCQWEQLRAVTSKDAYAAAHAFSARAQMQGITYHRERGEIQRVKVNL